jgi:hypothetical protein
MSARCDLDERIAQRLTQSIIMGTLAGTVDSAFSAPAFFEVPARGGNSLWAF